MATLRVFLNITFIFLFFCISCAQNQNDRSEVRNPDFNKEGLEIATLAGGCFWCVEAVFERVEGVEGAVSGYIGGKEKNPSYEDVAAGKTGHAEAVQVYFDPQTISYNTILEIFFATHDPTTLNRQGPDVGRQYRSAIFYHSEAQKQKADEYIERLTKDGKFRNPIVTELVPFSIFYEAEAYHQDYYEQNPGNPYIISVTRPKIIKFQKEFKEYLKQEYR